MDYLFQYMAFPEGYELVLNVPHFEAQMNRILRNTTGIKKVKFVGNDNNNACSMQYAFLASSVELIDFTEWGNGEIKGTYINQLTNGANNLHTILGVWDCSNFVNVLNAFAEAPALVEIRLKTNTLSMDLSFAKASLLSDASIQSIIDGLATVETQQTITFNADVKAKLTEEQKATISAKNWVLG